MKKIVTMLVGIVALAVPGVASAHTGSVKCDATGVVFQYDSNFQHNTLVTENVGDAQRIVTVTAHKASTDTWAGVTGSVQASANWSDGSAKGSIPRTTLNRPKPTPPVNPPTPTPPPVCPADTVSEGMSNGVLVCVRTVTKTVTLPAPAPVTNTVYVTVPASPVLPPKCPKGTKLYKNYGNAAVCIKKHTVVKTKIKMIPYTPVTQPKIGRAAGATG